MLLKEGIRNCTITTPGYETIELTGLRADKDLMNLHLVLLKKVAAAGIT